MTYRDDQITLRDREIIVLKKELSKKSNQLNRLSAGLRFGERLLAAARNMRKKMKINLSWRGIIARLVGGCVGAIAIGAGAYCMTIPWEFLFSETPTALSSFEYSLGFVLNGVVGLIILVGGSWWIQMNWNE